MKIFLLGPPRIVGPDGRPRPVRGHQTWAVLARLVLAGRPVERRILAGELFGETVDPMGALRWCLAALRRALGPDTLAGDPISLNLPPGTDVDILALNDGRAEVDEIGQLLEGIEPASGSDFALWLMIERERLATRLDEWLRSQTLTALARGQSDRALRLTRRALMRNPYDEGFHILLVKALVQAGRQDAALAHVQTTEALFAKELGLAPTSALRSAARHHISAQMPGVSAAAATEALLQSGVAALAAGAADAGVDCLRRAVTEAEKLAGREMLARALLELGTALVHALRGHDDEGSVLLRQAAELAREGGFPKVAARALRELGYVEALAGRRPAAATVLDEALTFAEGETAAQAGIHSVTGFNQMDWGRHDAARHSFETALELARQAGETRREIWTLGIGGWGQLAAGDPELARDWLDQCLARCDQANWVAFRPWPVAVMGETLLRLGQNRADLATLESAYALSCQLGDPCWQAATGRSIALSLAAEGATSPAIEWLDRAQADCQRVSDPYAGLLVEILADRVRLARSSGQRDRSEALARQLLQLVTRTHADGHLSTAVELLGRG